MSGRERKRANRAKDAGIQPPQTIAVIGAGPKAAAIAAKAAVLRGLRKAAIEVLVLDRGQAAHNWKGDGGFTDGTCTLGTPPEKDVGFPYGSEFGQEVDQAMLSYSWPAYQIQLSSTTYSGWVDRGRRHPTHGEWGNYLGWVLGQAGANVRAFREVISVEAAGNRELLIRTRSRGREEDFRADGLVLTGPGNPRGLDGNEVAKDDPHVLDGRSYWLNIEAFRYMESGKVAVVGGGETAASVAVSILEANPKITVEIVNRAGALFSRGESFFENALFSTAEGWRKRPIESRERIIRRTDRGVFSVDAMSRLSESMNVRFRGETVEWIGSTAGGMGVRFAGADRDELYNRVVLATGFDPWTSLDILGSSLGLRISAEVMSDEAQRRRREISHSIDHHLRLPHDAFEGTYYNIHVPMLAALSQGPGFPNLSCLGLTADRIISTYIGNRKDSP